MQIDGARSLQKTLEEADKQLVPLVEGNLVDSIWQGRPDSPRQPLRVHRLEHAGESCQDKQKRIWGQCKQAVPGGGFRVWLCAVGQEMGPTRPVTEQSARKFVGQLWERPVGELCPGLQSL